MSELRVWLNDAQEDPVRVVLAEPDSKPVVKHEDQELAVRVEVMLSDAIPVIGYVPSEGPWEGEAVGWERCMDRLFYFYRGPSGSRRIHRIEVHEAPEMPVEGFPEGAVP